MRASSGRKAGLVLLVVLPAVGCAGATIGSSSGGAAAASSSGGNSGSSTGGSTGVETGTGGASGTTGLASAGGTGSGGTGCPGGTYGSTEFQPCNGLCQCAAPFVCVNDGQLGVSLCEEPCNSESDCSSLEALCNGATCSPVPCGPAFGGAFDSACEFADGGGTCIPFGPSFGFAFDWRSIGLCSQGGTAALGQSCEPQPSRPDPAGSICAAGTVCGPNTDGPPFAGPVELCLTPCNPQETSTCGEDAGNCLALESRYPSLGFCEPASGGAAVTCQDAGLNCTAYTDCCSLDCNGGFCQ